MKARLFPLTFGFVLACALAAHARQAGAQPTHRVSPPGKDWALDVALPGFNIHELDGDRGDREVYLLGRQTNDKRSPVVFIRLLRAWQGGGTEEVRELSLRAMKKSGAIKVGGLRTSEYKRIPVVHYTQGVQLQPPVTMFEGMKCAEAYFVHDGFWVFVRLMSQSFDEEEEGLFRSVLDSVRFTDTTRPASSFDYFHKGRPLYKAAEYAKAVEYYRAALELERKERRLAAATWRALVADLGNAYGATRDYARAKEVLEYGLAHEPARFWFNYNLARVYAAQGDLDNTVAFLEKAALYRKDAGEKASALSPPPDPLNDPVFARFKKVDKFKKAAKAVR